MRYLRCHGPCHLYFSFVPEADAAAKLEVKVEINTREHTPLHPIKTYPFVLESSWYSSKADIRSYEPEELFGTKLRALLQRRKNRDLFDLNEGLQQLELDPAKVIAVFEHYLALQGVKISRAQAEEFMLKKLTRSLVDDIAPLLPAGVVYGENEARVAFEAVWFQLITRIKGDPWKGSDAVVAELRKRVGDTFLRG